MNASSIRCLITAGPTREYFDPVRFISNPSSGKMGFALAEAAAEAGWSVDLVAGPVSIPEPDNPDIIVYPVETGEEMFHQVDALFDASDVIIMTAAVTDFRPVQRAAHKVKKGDAELTVTFEPTLDILKTMTQRRRDDQLVVGFAAETRDIEAYARKKLVEKRCDLIAANLVGKPGSGFAGDENALLLIFPEGSSEELGSASKVKLAQALIARLEKLLP